MTTTAAKGDAPHALLAWEQDKLEAETARERAETAKLEAEAATARCDAELARLTLETLQRGHREEAATDARNHVYKFNEPVTAVSVVRCIANLSMWSRLEPGCDIEIVFNSPGGSVIDGFALYDFLTELRSRRHRVTTVCRGMAASMAGVLLQAGDVRVMGAESVLLVHEISFGAGGKIGEVEDEVAFAKMLTQRVLRIFEKRTALSAKQIDARWRRKDWWLDSDEALKLGFVDEIR